MHQTYWFQIAVPKDADQETLKEHARVTFEDFINHHADENNWYQVEMLLLKDSTVLQLCDNGDWRGREALAEHFLLLPPDKRWVNAVQRSIIAVALDLGLGGSSSFWWGDPDDATARVLDLTPEQLIQAILQEVPRSIARLYQDLADGRAVDRWPGEQSYLRRSRGRTFEMFLSADVKPFASPDSPYYYPCYNLVEDIQGDEQVALLAVDIHT